MKTFFLSFFKRRVIFTLTNSLHGIKSAWRTEESFRVEVVVTLFLIPVAFFITQNQSEFLILVLSLILVLVVELINTAIEKTIDRISLERNETSKLVKDLGSAAVFLMIICAATIWIVVLSL